MAAERSALTYPLPSSSKPRLATPFTFVAPEPVWNAHLRVAFVTETYPPEANGAAMTIGRLVDALLQRGHDVQLVRPRQSAGEPASSRPRFSEILTVGWALPFDRSMHFGGLETERLARLWRARRPDVVHVATEGLLGLSALWAARRLRIPVSSSFHTNFDRYAAHYRFGWLRSLASWYLRRLHNQAACTLVPTGQMVEDLERRGYRNLKVLSRGVDAQLYRPDRRSLEIRREWGLGPEDTAALYVGRLAPEKNLPLAIEAFQAMHRAEPHTRFVLVGDGPLRASLAREHPELVFAGRRQAEDLAVHYASGDILLFPSLTETFGNVTLEAMASGLAVVAFDDAAARVLIRDGCNGLLAPAGDARAFVARAVRAVTERAVSAQCGLLAARAAKAQSWEAVGATFESVLVEVAGRSGSAPCA